MTDSYVYKAFGLAIATTGTTVNPFRYLASLQYYYDSDPVAHFVASTFFDGTIARFLTRHLKVHRAETLIGTYTPVVPSRDIDPLRQVSKLLSLKWAASFSFSSTTRRQPRKYPTGRPLSPLEAAICQKYQSIGILPPRTAGGVVCYCGVLVPCYFGRRDDDPRMIDCIIAHEMDHLSRVKEGCCQPGDPPFRVGADPECSPFGNKASEECRAYLVELDCLVGKCAGIQDAQEKEKCFNEPRGALIKAYCASRWACNNVPASDPGAPEPIVDPDLDKICKKLADEGILNPGDVGGRPL